MKKRRTSLACKTLAIFVQSLEGSRVVVELTNDSIVRGLLEAADDFGNVILSTVTCQPLQRASSRHEFLYIRARYVRYIHVPPGLDPDRSIKAYRQKAMAAARAAAQAGGVKLVKGAGPDPTMQMQHMDGSRASPAQRSTA